MFDIYYTEFLTLCWLAMLVNEYRLYIQFNKVRKVRNSLDPDHWNVGLHRTYAHNRLYTASLQMRHFEVFLVFAFFLTLDYIPISKF